jgi:hypothetical protein
MFSGVNKDAHPCLLVDAPPSSPQPESGPVWVLTAGPMNFRQGATSQDQKEMAD